MGRWLYKREVSSKNTQSFSPHEAPKHLRALQQGAPGNKEAPPPQPPSRFDLARLQNLEFISLSLWISPSMVVSYPRRKWTNTKCNRWFCQVRGDFLVPGVPGNEGVNLLLCT